MGSVCSHGCCGMLLAVLGNARPFAPGFTAGLPHATTSRHARPLFDCQPRWAPGCGETHRSCRGAVRTQTRAAHDCRGSRGLCVPVRSGDTERRAAFWVCVEGSDRSRQVGRRPRGLVGFGACNAHSLILGLPVGPERKGARWPVGLRGSATLRVCRLSGSLLRSQDGVLRQRLRPAQEEMKGGPKRVGPLGSPADNPHRWGHRRCY